MAKQPTPAADHDSAPAANGDVMASFRSVLSHYPTGAAAVAATPVSGPPAAMVVGSFTSVSLDPPLVGFFADRKSTSWPRIHETGHFCVSVLGGDQEEVCQRLASKAPDKLAGLSWRPALSGAPALTGAVAWIDCDIERVDDAGDHHFVLGRVRELQVRPAALPLLFYRGGYGHFQPGIMVSGELEITGKLGYLDAVRPAMEALAARLGTTCTAVIRAGRQTILAAAAGTPAGSPPPPQVGTRFPFAPPLGAVFAAWGTERDAETWSHSGDRPRCEQMLETVRHHGYSIGLGHATHASIEDEARLPGPEQPLTGREMARRVTALTSAMADYNPAELAPGRHEVRHVSAPVLGPDGVAALELTLWGPGTAIGRDEIETRAAALLAACADAAAALERTI